MGIMTYIAAFLAGAMASMGLGGGMVLIVYLTIFENMPQLKAQGINLIFFIPAAIIALIIHAKNGLVDTKKAIPAACAGIASSVIFGFAAVKTDSEILSKAFAIFLIIMGIKEVFGTPHTHVNKTSQ